MIHLVCAIVAIMVDALPVDFNYVPEHNCIVIGTLS